MGSIMRGLIFLICFCLMIGCSFFTKEDQIHWKKDGMESALELAKKENKPLLVYWGADWCPPCNVLKSTIFKEKVFIDATRNYLAVFLDGDHKNAQKWGDKLDVVGYPTLMILAPNGTEVVRLWVGAGARELAETLNYAYNSLEPVEPILNRIIAEGKSPQAQQLQLLSQYSWMQDNNFVKKPLETAKKLLKLSEMIEWEKFPTEKAKIDFAAASFLSNYIESNKNDKKKIQDQFRSHVVEMLKLHLKEEKYFRPLLYYWAYYSSSILKEIIGEEPMIKELGNQVIEKSQKLLLTQKLSYEEELRCLSTLPGLADEFPRLFKVTEEQKSQYYEKYKSLLDAYTDPRARIAIVNSAGYTLGDFGMYEEAKELLVKELKISPHPYYLMSSLGYMEKKQGNKVAAIDWYKKSYEASIGEATQLQWGAGYISNLIELLPKDSQTIFEQTQTVFKKNIDMSDAFMGRNRKVLERLKKQLISWAEKNHQSEKIKNVFSRQKSQCEKMESSQNSYYKKECHNYFNWSDELTSDKKKSS